MMLIAERLMRELRNASIFMCSLLLCLKFGIYLEITVFSVLIQSNLVMVRVPFKFGEVQNVTWLFFVV